MFMVSEECQVLDCPLAAELPRSDPLCCTAHWALVPAVLKRLFVECGEADYMSRPYLDARMHCLAASMCADIEREAS